MPQNSQDLARAAATTLSTQHGEVLIAEVEK